MLPAIGRWFGASCLIDHPYPWTSIPLPVGSLLSGFVPPAWTSSKILAPQSSMGHPQTFHISLRLEDFYHPWGRRNINCFGDPIKSSRIARRQNCHLSRFLLSSSIFMTIKAGMLTHSLIPHSECNTNKRSDSFHTHGVLIQIWRSTANPCNPPCLIEPL